MNATKRRFPNSFCELEINVYEGMKAELFIIK